jgi:hypothetical protein
MLSVSTDELEAEEPEELEEPSEDEEDPWEGFFDPNTGKYYLWNRETEAYVHNVVYGRDGKFWEYYLDEATNSVWWWCRKTGETADEDPSA